jgi:transglutaminase-like putative cysteine protease
VQQSLPAAERFFQFALLGLVASGYLAIAGSGYVDLPTVVLAGIGLLWRGAIVSGISRLHVSDRAVAIATLLYMAFAPVDYFLLSKTWITATVHVVFFVAIVKTLTARTSRDYLFVAAVAFIEILAAALFSLSGTFFVCLAVYLLCAVCAMASSEVRRLSKGDFLVTRGSRELAPRLFGISLVMTCGILFLSAGLFFLLPRTANAALHFLASNRYHLTGFSNDVMLGDVGELKSDTRAVMHVKSRGRELPPSLKWRGLALERFDGRRWSTDPGGFRLSGPQPRGIVLVADDWQRRRPGRRLLYQVTIQNVDADALFVAGIPEFLNVGHTGVIRAPNGSFRFGFFPSDTVQYEVSSFLEPRDALGDALAGKSRIWRLPATEHEQDLKLPVIDPRIPSLARKLSQGARTDFEKARLLEQKLRTRYTYSLELPQKESVDPLADFLFTRKKGYCEYFASSMTVMLRTLGIPARLVNGFQSGMTNPYSGMLVIRASDAHTWVEAFFPETGWTVFDPTPLAGPNSQQNVWSKLNLYLDAADTFWREWVLSYDLGQQITLASRLEMQARRIRTKGLQSEFDSLLTHTGQALRALSDFGPFAIWILLVGGALVLVLTWLSKSRPSTRARAGRSAPGDATLFYQRMLKLMKKRGYQKPVWLTPLEFSSSVGNGVADDLDRFTAAYYAVRFGGSREASRDMAAALEKLISAPRTD